MNANLKLKQSVAGFMILAMLHLCWVTSFAWAERVATDAVVVPAQTEIQNPRQRLMALINREDVQEQLEHYGISRVEAAARVNSLTDEEVTLIAGKLDELPPGGDIRGIILYIILWPFILMVNLLICGPIIGIDKILEGDAANPDAFANCMYFSFFWTDIKGGSSEEEPYIDDYEEDCDPGIDSCL